MTIYTPERELQLLRLLDPAMRPDVDRVLASCRNLVDLHKLECRLVVFETFRTIEKQWANWQKGRVRRDGRWVKIGPTVTNAKPDESPHCTHRRDGERLIPSSLAIDLWLLEVDEDKLLGDRDERWAVIPLAVSIAAGETLRSGCFFRFGSGDWPHVEHREWKTIAEAYRA